MTRGLYTAYTGMLAQQLKMDTISNNMANVNTTGYKQEEVIFESFNEVLMLKINDPEQAGAQKIGKTNYGNHVSNIYTKFEQGAMQETDNPLNIGLQGTGMIAVGKMDSEGNLTTKYTRDGSFVLDSSGRLTTSDGYFVLGNDGPITLESSEVRIDEKGAIYQGSQLIDQIQVTDFEDLNALKKIGGNIYESTEASVEKAFTGTVTQGFLESSNVNSINEMVNMINVMRTYEASQKVMQTYDQTMDKAVNDVGRL